LNKIVLLFIFYFLRCPTITPVHKNIEVSKLLTPPKYLEPQNIEEIPAVKEEKSPVICRVLKKSDKDSFHMYDIYDIFLIDNYFNNM